MKKFAAISFVLLAGAAVAFAHADATPGQVIRWQKTKDVVVDARSCEDDVDCGAGERCRVLSIDAQPVTGVVYASDVRGRFAAARAAAAKAARKAEPPVCEGECAPYSGDLTVRVSKPVAICIDDDAGSADDDER